MKKKYIFSNYPSEWKTYSFEQLFDFEGGLSVSRDKLSDEGICYLHYGDIHKTTDNYVDVQKDYHRIPKYNEKLENINEKYLLKDGDIVFADASEDYEGIGKAVVILNKENIPFISGLHTIVAKDKTDLIFRDYKRFFLSDWNIRRQMMFYATGISVLGISKTSIKKVIVSLPSKSEQEKIASILSTWDKAIELKEKLIEQKKELKKGLMQKLLTGKVRLPGFEGEWKKIRLGSVIEECTEKTTVNNQYPVLTSSRKGIFLQEEYFSKQVASEDNIGYKVVRKGDFTYRTMSDDGNFVFNQLEEYEVGIVSPAYAVFKATNINPLFLKSILNSYDFKKNILKNVQGGTRLSYKYSDLKNTVVKVPPKEEQEAIAEVIFNMENNLNLLEQELEALKQQKKGLMQLLLTGKVRVKV
jgi:type I restriction enzyme, S subunit